MEVHNLDPVSAKLAIQLQLDDVCDILHGSEVGSDEYAAFQAMQISFQEIIQVLEGQCHALNMLRMEHNTRLEFESLLQEERQAANDHREALRLSGLDPGAPASSLNKLEDSPDTGMHAAEELALTFQTASVDQENDVDSIQDNHLICGVDNIPHGEFSPKEALVPEESLPPKAGPSKGKRKAGADHEIVRLSHGICSACMEEHPRFDLLELACKRKDDTTSHAYCRTCLIDLFNSSLTDTTLFPPRCCRVPIRLSACMHLLPSKLIQQCEEKEAELATENPVYCSNTSCVRFIPPKNVMANIATCLECSSKTCAICKNPNHHGVCPKDPIVQMLMDVASKKKWIRCYQCRTMVELLHGCYHIRCMCGSEFCYLCGKPWKTCGCSKWDENRLLGNALANDDHPRQIVMPEEEEMLDVNPTDDVSNEMNARLAAVADGFAINDHDEDQHSEGGGDIGRCHHNWHRVYSKASGLDVCGICGYHLKFLNHCKTCETRVCNRCLHNRL